MHWRAYTFCTAAAGSRKRCSLCPPLANFAQRIYGYVDKAHVTPEQVEVFMTARIRPYVK